MSKKEEKETKNSKTSQADSNNPLSEQQKKVKHYSEKKDDNKKKVTENLGKDKQTTESEEKIVGLKKELEDLKEKNLRLLAELKNQEKNHRVAITEAIKYGNERLIQQFLFFPDNYERALQVVQQIEQEPNQDPKLLQKKIKDLLEGLRMILM